MRILLIRITHNSYESVNIFSYHPERRHEMFSDIDVFFSTPAVFRNILRVQNISEIQDGILYDPQRSHSMQESVSIEIIIREVPMNERFVTNRSILARESFLRPSTNPERDIGSREVYVFQPITPAKILNTIKSCVSDIERIEAEMIDLQEAQEGFRTELRPPIAGLRFFDQPQRPDNTPIRENDRVNDGIRTIQMPERDEVELEDNDLPF